jgi:hypothetical protein
MKKKYVLILFIFIVCNWQAMSQIPMSGLNANSSLLNSYRLPIALEEKVKLIDFDNDGDPDILETYTINNIPVRWLDDDDDMKRTDTEGDLDNDCLMINRNRDGKFGSYGDLIIDWIDTNNDGQADMQVVVDYAAKENKNAWGPGHFMWVMDIDSDNIFNYIDWKTFKLRCWIHNGQSDFFEDYHGKSMFTKTHTSSEKLDDLRLNCENPFLFYDPDNDGLTEMVIRLLDSPPIIMKDRTIENNRKSVQPKGTIDIVSLSFDLDNDNSPQDPFDLDMTIQFHGDGFNYMDQVHHFNNKTLPGSDSMFMDPRWRNLTELIYTDHESAWDLIHKRGQWKSVYFNFDEDDDCARWERVELYEPLNIFKIGARKGGLDNNPQADVTGDRGEWDMDNSGKGNLYVGKFDGRIHLCGAEWGVWRIDQNASFYQGMGGLYDGYGPGRLQAKPQIFPTVKYTDTNNNGFIDEISYDLDGDTIFEHVVSLLQLGINDQAEIVPIAQMKYNDFASLYNTVSENMWKNAIEALNVAEKRGLNLSWYSLMRNPKSPRQKYNYGYWLQFYIYRDLLDLGIHTDNPEFLNDLNEAYFSGNWKLINKHIKP